MMGVHQQVATRVLHFISTKMCTHLPAALEKIAAGWANATDRISTRRVTYESDLFIFLAAQSNSGKLEEFPGQSKLNPVCSLYNLSSLSCLHCSSLLSRWQERKRNNRAIVKPQALTRSVRDSSSAQSDFDLS